MYAIIQIGANQYKIQKGETITVPRLESQDDKPLTFEKVLLVDDGQKVSIGQPFLVDARVEAKIVRPISGRKTLAFKFRRRKSSSTQRGHRQRLTAITITDIKF